MGTFEVNVRVLSMDGSEHEDAAMLVDTGATFSMLPASMLRRLGVAERLQIEGQYASGQVETLMVGLGLMEIEGFEEQVPVLISFGREGSPHLLGAHALEAFRLVVDPIDKTLHRRRALLM